jgi:ABC-type sugar transport system permease subunit
MDTAARRATPEFDPTPWFRWAGAFALVFLGAFADFHLLKDGYFPLAAMLSAVVIFLFLIIIKKSLTPYRWMAVGLIMAFLFTIFPILYTFYLSFMNMSSGHLVTQPQAVTRILSEVYTPDDSKAYSWEGYKDGSGNWLLLITDDQGASFTTKPGQAPTPFTLSGDAPDTINGYTHLDPVAKLQTLQDLTTVEFGVAPELLTVQDMSSATVVKPKFTYDSATDTMTDVTTGTKYVPKGGTYTSPAGETLTPGFTIPVGLDNYAKFLGNPGFFAPMAEIITWNVAFSFFSVVISFIIGMVIALLFEDLPGKRIIRALLILPYPIPVLVSIMVWRGLLNDNMGLVTTVITSIFGSAPHFFTDTSWTRFAVILINVYLSYPYFFILCSGALKSIPKDLYEAAEIDGATPWVAFKAITLPMLLRILMPLLIASFSFNFNNFTIIWGFNAGLPAMADTVVPMGHTDLLISFIYRLGFSQASVADYGFSAAITVLLFVVVGLFVFLQTRNTKSIKETN